MLKFIDLCEKEKGSIAVHCKVKQTIYKFRLDLEELEQ